MLDLSPHPDADTLAAYAQGHLSALDFPSVEAHIAVCEACCQRLNQVGAGSLLELAREAMATSVANLGETPGPGSAVPPELHDHPRYQVLEQLGAGGMGVVFKAEHRVMGRLVALKVLNARTLSRPGAVDRFRREVRLAARLAHPNIITAHDADEVNGLHFLIMEFVEGISLDRLVAKRGPLTVAMACHFIRQAALGLQHAHGKGMIHRDIKPQNLMVTKKGQVKVLDFGLACVARGMDDSPTTATAAPMTTPDMVLGTPDFLSPEQARSSATVDGRTDLYSLGCTLYFLLTGRPPFPTSQPFEKLLAHVQDPVPDVRHSRPEVPASLADLLVRMMAKNPDHRPQSPAEVAAALAPFTKSVPVPVAEPVTRAVPAVRPSPSPAKIPAGVTVAVRAVDQDTDERPRRKRRNPVSVFQRHRPALIAGVLALGTLILAGFLARFGPWGPRTPPTTDPARGTNPRTTDEGRIAGQTASRPEVLIILPTRDVWSGDYEPVRERLERGGLAVRTAGLTRNPSPRHAQTPGDPIRPDLTLAEVDPTQFRGLIFIAAGVDEYLPGRRGAADTRRLIDAMIRDHNPIGAICIGSRVLVEHGYLNGRSAARTDFPEMFRNAEVKWDSRRIVTERPFVTAGADRDAEQFVAAFLPMLR